MPVHEKTLQDLQPGERSAQCAGNRYEIALLSTIPHDRAAFGNDSCYSNIKKVAARRSDRISSGQVYSITRAGRGCTFDDLLYILPYRPFGQTGSQQDPLRASSHRKDIGHVRSDRLLDSLPGSRDVEPEMYSFDHRVGGQQKIAPSGPHHSGIITDPRVGKGLSEHRYYIVFPDCCLRYFPPATCQLLQLLAGQIPQSSSSSFRARGSASPQSPAVIPRSPVSSAAISAALE